MKRTVLAAIVAAGLLAGFGCSGGGQQVAPIAPQPQQPQRESAPATLTLKVPVSATTSASAKRPAYVSAGTQSITFSGTGIATQTISLAPIATTCPPSGGFYVCSLKFAAPVGNSTLTVKTFASTDGSGTPLSLNTIPISIVQDQTNAIPVTLNGVVSTLVLTLSASTVTAGTAQAITASLGGKDAAGNAIVGPGSFVDATGAALTPTLQSSDGTNFTVGSQSGYSWSVAYSGAAVTAPTLTLIAGALTNATQQITVNPAPSPSPGGGNVITNGDFASGTLSGWYVCYTAHNTYTAPINPSPAPTGGTTQGSGGVTPAGTPRPAPTPTTPPIVLSYSGDAGVQTTTPTGDVGGFAHFAEVGHSEYPYNLKGGVGICQDVAVPASGTLSFSLYEGGNDSFPTSNSEAKIFPFGSFSSATDGATTAATPAPLFAESNCYNNLGSAGGTRVAWGSSTGSTRAKICGDNTVPWPGGKWYAKSFDVSSYAGQSVTVFLGTWRSAQSGAPSTSTYYNYAYFANVQLVGTGGSSSTPAPLSVAPNPFTATQTGAATLTASETGLSGNLTVSSDNASVVTVTSPATAGGGTATIHVNVVNAGFANIMVTDSHGQSVVIPVTVTLTPVTIN